ncbi:MAG: glycosyltransferase family 4 protein [Herpetosiphonaceae bacterium]|nr:glycosyltransferase family 4 protein [Herpetosiphonaceae bacterium]
MPVTIVLPWYGPDTAGGAEAHARQLVQALQQAGVEVEVWTTTARDARTPLAPYYPVGWSTVDGIPVRRFPATCGHLPPLVRRAPARFGLDKCSIHEWHLLESLASSDELLATLEAERLSRRWVFFLYAFPTTFFGAQLAGDHAALIPCLHDEPYARYMTTRHLLCSVPLIMANSRAEVQLIQQISGRPTTRCPIVGEGIDLTAQGDGLAFRRAHGLAGPLLFFMGRRDHTKNFPLLLAYLERRWAEHGPQPQLLVAGAGQLHVPPALRPWIYDLGFVSEAEKYSAYAAADIFCMPSVLESYSLVVMEAWLHGTPALVHADCAVTVDHCRQANAGLWFRSYREFDACLDRLLDSRVGPRLGQNGRDFVLRECRWEDVAHRFIHALNP